MEHYDVIIIGTGAGGGGFASQIMLARKMVIAATIKSVIGSANLCMG